MSHSVTNLKKLIYYEVNLEVGFREFQLRVAEFVEFAQAGCWILSYESLKIKNRRFVEISAKLINFALFALSIRELSEFCEICCKKGWGTVGEQGLVGFNKNCADFA